MLAHFLLLTAVAGVTAAAAVPQTHTLHEKRDHHLAASKLVKKNRVPAAATLPVRIGLKQRNLDNGHDWLMDVTDPTSANYGKFWSPEDIIDTFAPLDETVESVRSWLMTETGLAADRITHSDNKAWLAVDMPADTAEKLLHTSFHHYEHAGSGSTYIGCDEYHVPKSIQPHVDYITPGVKSIKVKPTLERRAHTNHRTNSNQPLLRAVDGVYSPDSLNNCDNLVTPACIRALYNFNQTDPNIAVSASNSFGVFEDGDFYAQEDLDLFFANYTTGANRIPNGTHPILDSVDGGEAPVPVEYAGAESDLDMELIYPIIYPQTVTLYQTDDYYYSSGEANSSGIFNTFFDALDGSYCTYCAFGECGDDPALDPIYPDDTVGGFKGRLECGIYKPTNVISISYGEQESQLPNFYQLRQCNEFLKLGLQGTSIFVASGDTGVGGYPDDPTPYGCLGPDDNVFSPTQPNSCPYLTNVGGTEILPGNTVADPESSFVILDDGFNYTSGGGFSNIFGVPSYQRAAVAAYFAAHDPPYPYYLDGNYLAPNNTGLYNRNGRGIPDVAAIGNDIAVYNEGVLVAEGGTSASSPIFASLVNRIVEERLRVGKGPLGLINPVLYAHPEVLVDVVHGSNPGCGVEGFSAVEGWDPVTGLGTPDYPKMLELFLSLP